MELREGIILSYENEILTLDPGTFGAGRTSRKVKVKELTDVQIFADISSVEIFVNRGEEVFTSRIYSMEGKISLEGDCQGTMKIYLLKGFTIEKGFDA